MSVISALSQTSRVRKKQIIPWQIFFLKTLAATQALINIYRQLVQRQYCHRSGVNYFKKNKTICRKGQKN